MQRLIALRRDHPVFRRSTFFAGREDAAGIPDAWWFRPDGRKMTRRDWEAVGGPRSASSSTAARSASAPRAASPSSTTPSSCSSTPTTSRPTFTLPPRRFGTRWTLELYDRRPGRRAVSYAARRRSGRGRARSSSCGAHRERSARASCHLPAPARAVAELRRRARARALPARARRQPPLPLADHAGAARLDPRLRRRRPDARLRGARRRRGAPRALQRRARRSCSTSCPTTWRERRGEPLLARPRAARDASSTSTSRRGRHRRFFDVDDLAGVRVEDPEVFEATHRTCSSSSREGLVDGLRIDHIDGLADPRALPRAPARRGRRADLGREDPRAAASSCATGRSRARPATSSRTTSQALFVDPAGEQRAERAHRRVARPTPRSRDAAKREQARTTFQPELERLRRAARPPRSSRTRSPRSTSTAPTSSPTSGRVERRRPRGARRAPRRRCAACCCSRSAATTSSSSASSRRPAP